MAKNLLIILGFFTLACGTYLFGPPSVTHLSLPTLTPTPVFARWSAIEVMRTIKDINLEAEQVHLLNPQEYGSLPPLAIEAIRFSTPSLCPNCGGTILSFDDPIALQTIKTYYTQINPQDDPTLSSWVFEKDNILIQLSGELSEARALQYGSVLIRLEH